MRKFEVLLRMLLAVDPKDAWISMQDGECQCDVQTSSPNEDYRSVSVLSNKKGVWVDGVKDEELTVSEAKEIFEVIEEKYKQRQEYKLQYSWAKFGVVHVPKI